MVYGRVREGRARQDRAGCWSESYRLSVVVESGRGGVEGVQVRVHVLGQ